MSWLNSIKDQISTLAQEVLAETAGPGDFNISDNVLPISDMLGEVQLQKLCSEQKEEIAMLRKQIEDLQKGSQIPKSGAISGDESQNVKPIQKNSTDLEESWSWELPDVPQHDYDNTSIQSTTNENEPQKLSDVQQRKTFDAKTEQDKTEAAFQKQIDILENEKERLSRALEDLNSQHNNSIERFKKDQEITVNSLQNHIEQLENEKATLSRALEELDSQHNVAMQNVLGLKTDLQGELSRTAKDLETLKEEKAKLMVNYEIEMCKMKKQLEELEEKCKESELNQLSLREHVESTQNELKLNNEELKNVQMLLQKKEQDNKELIERIKCLSKDHEELKLNNEGTVTNLEKISKELEETKKLLNEQKTSESSGSFSVKLSDDDFIVVREGDANSSGPTTPPTKEELKEKILQLENRVSELTLKNGSLTLKLTNEENQVAEEDIVSKEYESTAEETDANDLSDMLKQQSSRQVTNLDDDDDDVVVPATLEVQEESAKIAELEQNVEQLTAALVDIRNAKLMWEHDKKTLEADISQYVIQCDELMKNNEILLNELENYKCNKLQTILEEHSEENILQLETQLEQCTMLNQSFKDTENELNEKIDELESEKQLLTEELRGIQMEFEKFKNSQDEVQIENMFLKEENASLLMELSNLKTLEIKEVNDMIKNYADFNMQVNMDEKNTMFEEKQIQTEDVLPPEPSVHLEEQAVQTDGEDFIKLHEAFEKLSAEKDGFIKALEMKHAESLQYYNEIQHLQNIIKQLQHEIQLEKNIVKSCENCIVLQTKISELSKEHEKFQDQIVFLKEKSDILTTNLLTEQTNQRLAQEEKQTVIDQNNILQKELLRLREHLLEVEEQQTEVSVTMQRELDEYKARINELESQISHSSTAYTSASIRANQHAETLQAQYVVLLQQRDELLVKLSMAEDLESKNQAALSNLQCALEKFQNDKENDIKAATQRIRKEILKEEEHKKRMQTEIDNLNQQLSEANSGLLAAARLSDELDTCQKIISTLREEVEELKQQNSSLEQQLMNSEGSQADKIEKSLIKSLIIGYLVSSNANDKHQVLRMITSILEFTQSEENKIGLSNPPISWLGSILGQTTNVNSNPNEFGKENLAQAFVQFLEKESQPKTDVMPNLLHVTQPDILSNQAKTMRRTSVTDKSSTPIPIQPLLLDSNIMDEFSPSRNSSSILKDILNDS